MLTLLQLETFLSPVLPDSDANGQVSLLRKKKTKCLMKQTTEPQSPKKLTALLQLVAYVSICALEFALQ